MRHEKAETLLRIAIDMQGRRGGLSLQDIATRYTDAPLSRRSAERLRNAVLRLFPGQVEELVGDQQVKSWRLRTPSLKGLRTVDHDTLASLDTAARLLEQAGLEGQSGTLDALRAMLIPIVDSRIEPGFEEEEAPGPTECVAIRPGPRVRFRPEVLQVAREALQRRQVLRIGYRYRKTKLLRQYDVHPLGLLFGHRHYLVAARKPAGPPRYFILGLIETADILSFTSIPPPDFSLARHADRSFGLWQEDPIDVHWRFRPEVADLAAEFLFHPSQVSERSADGSLHVRFRAGGLVEMDWHLYQWGDGVELIHPTPRQWQALLRQARQNTGGFVCP